MLTVGRARSVNVARPRPNPYKSLEATGHDKRPVSGPVRVRAPGSKADGLGSGLVGDTIGDRAHHGGDGQAVYAYAREVLDRWQDELGHALPDGAFGENLTTEGIDVDDARIGERWRVGDTVELQVTGPRIPCATFRGVMDRPGWLRTFVASGRPGAYLAVVSAGRIRSGDPVTVTRRPDHDVTVSLVLRALTREPELLPALLVADDLPDDVREMAEAGQTFRIG